MASAGRGGSATRRKSSLALSRHSEAQAQAGTLRVTTPRTPATSCRPAPESASPSAISRGESPPPLGIADTPHDIAPIQVHTFDAGREQCDSARALQSPVRGIPHALVTEPCSPDNPCSGPQHHEADEKTEQQNERTAKRHQGLRLYHLHDRRRCPLRVSAPNVCGARSLPRAGRPAGPFVPEAGRAILPRERLAVLGALSRLDILEVLLVGSPQGNEQRPQPREQVCHGRPSVPRSRIPGTRRSPGQRSAANPFRDSAGPYRPEAAHP